MSDNKNDFKVSQELQIIPHQKGKAYPISVNEWEFLKKKIKEVKVDVNNFYAIGFLLLGICGSCFITILATDFKEAHFKYLTWAICGVSLIGGLLSIYFAIDKNKQENSKPTEIVNQMELIESRFESIKE